ncbi:MAG: hypothetical protein HQL23_03830 [Candidatus Omnitrophica bacterium]|nr:hypothetical protein [Candidatus Omnitrophota bacterium]
MVISISKITSKRQITLPVKVMSRLKLHPGGRLVFEETDGRVEIKSVAATFTIADFVKKYRGMVSKKLSDQQIRDAREEAWVARAGR